jgi:hypothetical protein
MAVHKEKKSLRASTAFRFVIVIGIANLFADLTYEGFFCSSRFTSSRRASKIAAEPCSVINCSSFESNPMSDEAG